MPRPSHPPRLHYSNNTWSSSLCSFLHSPVTSCEALKFQWEVIWRIVAVRIPCCTINIALTSLLVILNISVHGNWECL
jgi:hypothetical protein